MRRGGLLRYSAAALFAWVDVDASIEQVTGILVREGLRYSMSADGRTHRLLFGSAVFRYRGRDGSLAEYRRERLAPRERLRNAAAQAAGIPYFVRNCVVKALLVARLRPVARLLGEKGHWPY